MARLLDVLHRQGMEPQTDKEWEDYQKQKAERRAKNVANAVELLTRNEIRYMRTKDIDEGGLVLFTIGTIKYYPEEGKWYDAAQDLYRFGLRNLVKHLKGEVK
jgi:hypothetical protein